MPAEIELCFKWFPVCLQKVMCAKKTIIARVTRRTQGTRVT